MKRCGLASLPGHLSCDPLADVADRFLGEHKPLRSKALLNALHKARVDLPIRRPIVTNELSESAEPGLAGDVEHDNRSLRLMPLRRKAPRGALS